MSFLTVAYAALFYAATAILVAGLAYRIRLFAKSPAPLKIPTTPVPTTKSGVALRLFREVVFFGSLFKGNKWTWIFGYAFHFRLFLVLLRHLRYFIEEVPLPVALIQPIGKYAAFAMFQDEGQWWARARVVEKEAGGDRPVLGGPWRSKPEAKTAAEAFCDRRQAG